MEPLLDIEDIRTMLPHRYPFLLVDRILELRPGERIVGLKNVTINEPFFNGHFPEQAVMPGVLIGEAMAQVAGLMILTMPEHTGKFAYLAKMDNGRFRIPVVPGDTLIIEATLSKIRSTIGEVHTIARVNGRIAAEFDMTFAIKPPPETKTAEAKLQLIRDAIAAETASNTTHGTGDFTDDTPRTVTNPIHHGRTPLTAELVAVAGDRRD